MTTGTNLLVLVAKLIRLITVISWISIWVLLVIVAYTHYTYPETEKSIRPFFFGAAITTTVSYLLGFVLYKKSQAVRANVPRTFADRMFGQRSGIEDWLDDK